MGCICSPVDVKRLEGRVALVTGSSRGIGAAIARLLADEGAAVAVHGRDRAAVDSVRAEVQAAGGPALGVSGDVTDFAALERIRGEIEAAAGPVDILVANAGGTLVAPGPLEEAPVDAWRATVDANLTATFLTLKAFLPGMKERGRGDIVTMASTAGRSASPASPAYAAAKAGVIMLTRHLAQEEIG